MLEIQHSHVTDLPATGADGRGRAAALAALGAAPLGTAGFVEYRSRGLLLIVGPGRPALEAARALCEQLSCAVVAEDDAIWDDPDAERFLLARGEVRITGHLGAFTATLTGGGGEENLAPLAERGREHFDLVLDLSAHPHIGFERPPLGYQRPGSDPEALGEALAALPELVGEFQKPRFFTYDERICAHGSRGLTGCTRCLDACATGAIRSLGERVEVDPYLCQGCGSCAVVCPSGAMGYAFPEARDLLGALRRALRAYAEVAAAPPAVLFHDDAAGAEAVAAAAASLPERLIPVAVEDAGSIGPDVWLATLAFGASDVRILLPEHAEPSLRAATERQLALFRPVLEALQLAPERIASVIPGDGLRSLTLHEAHGRRAAGFSTSGGKRELLQRAFAHLYRPGRDRATTPLPAGAPFGRIQVDRDACTLCMACAAVCPVEAVASGGSLPRLVFHEERCLQCGLCETACPEDAITLDTRLHLPAFASPTERVLNEETPFHCVSCGKPFATEKMIARIGQQLAGHWMFQDERARRRLEMCEDCRVRDLFDEEASGSTHW